MMSDKTPAGIRWRLLLVALAFHAPGLRLFFKRKLPATARRENLAAGLVTLVSMVAIAWFSHNWMWVAAVWLIGHLLWGTRLAWIVIQRRHESNSQVSGQGI